MSLEPFIRKMPKAELHVHLEGAIRPATLLQLAQRNGVTLPAMTLEQLSAWYRFTDFAHFIDVYLTATSCIQTPDDIELIAREFLIDQAAQNIRYTEAHYTAFLHYRRAGLDFRAQLAALNRARTWAEANIGVTIRFIIDIAREFVQSEEEMLLIANWAIDGQSDGIVALGLGGPEANYPPELYRTAFDRARDAGLPCVPHAGETAGPASIWGALNALHADRICHGVRCMEDPALVDELRARQIPLDVCPTSNVCLGVATSLAEHPLPHMLEAGLYVTINSDDPPMFSTTLNDEYVQIAENFGFGIETMEQLTLNAVNAALAPEAERNTLRAAFRSEFVRLREEMIQ
jgi:adenosine deaminase